VRRGKERAKRNGDVVLFPSRRIKKGGGGGGGAYANLMFMLSGRTGEEKKKKWNIVSLFLIPSIFAGGMERGKKKS